MALVILVMVSTPTEGTLLPLLAPFVFAVAIWLLVQYRGGLVERLLMARVCQTLGLLSYSIYMTHLFFHGLLRNGWRVLSKHAFFQSGWGASLLDEGLTLALIAIVLLVSRFTYRKVEIPAQRWLNQLADRPRRAPVPAVEVAA
jgi:peptidoglycan/LPS O-acetylase OafA/YrhL